MFLVLLRGHASQQYRFSNISILLGPDENMTQTCDILKLRYESTCLFYFVYSIHIKKFDIADFPERELSVTDFQTLPRK